MKFENGKISWLETHFEIVSGIHAALEEETPNKAIERQEEQGTGGLYELSEELTDQFELQYKDHTWDGEYYDKIEMFLKENL